MARPPIALPDAEILADWDAARGTFVLPPAELDRVEIQARAAAGVVAAGAVQVLRSRRGLQRLFARQLERFA